MNIREAIAFYDKIVDLANNNSFCTRSGMGDLPVNTRIKFLVECFRPEDIERLYSIEKDLKEEYV